ncbi:hypothetical protein [Argonema galeatum]|uniref:hypothetical protein n=1 Tax=Argonema galeatum TaxID=2942762 RepID=UPI002012E1A9|nr:hypothetical protein [Argonema galeatum]MCL1467020.1 hypothetical protein [Argonema galeatum A003/A1]
MLHLSGNFERSLNYIQLAIACNNSIFPQPLSRQVAFATGIFSITSNSSPLPSVHLSRRIGTHVPISFGTGKFVGSQESETLVDRASCPPHLYNLDAPQLI